MMSSYCDNTDVRKRLGGKGVSQRGAAAPLTGMWAARSGSAASPEQSNTPR